MSFKGKVAVVTGASSGMGAATARALASAGAQVNLIDIDKKGAEETAQKTGSTLNFKASIFVMNFGQRVRIRDK